MRHALTLVPFVDDHCDQNEIVRLNAELKLAKFHIQQQNVELAHSRKIFDRSSLAAKIGVWECSLPDNELVWTDAIYDIFDLPRDTILEREMTLQCYSQASVEELKLRRSLAIEQRSGFTFDAEIVSFTGNRRWVRITATVESENNIPVRIFGMKQDITEQKILMDRTKYLAEFDLMTGLANRSQFQAKLSLLCENYSERKSFGALLLIDLDGFKKVNDTLGHSVGDEALKEVASRLRYACREADMVARIGGDEFAVLAGQSFTTHSIERLAQEITDIVRQPLFACGPSLALGASVGIAFMDTCSASEIFNKADKALYAAKAAGRNTYQIHIPVKARNM